MKISIVTVCLNASTTIRKTIQSVLNQSRKADEYIIIDGGSTDGTLDIIKEYGTFVTHIVSEKDKGISDAFNKGIQLATGDFIGILNADDWYEPSTLHLVETYGKGADILHGKIQYWRGAEKDYLAEGNHHFLAKEMTIHHPTVFIRKKVYGQLGAFRLKYRYAMDYDLVLRFYLAGQRFEYIPLILANMAFDGASDTNWHNAIRESLLSKVENGISPLQAYTYYYKQIIRTFMARTMKKAGLSSFVTFYRKRFSMVKKVS